MSVGANIAEGSSRRGAKEFRRFLDIARSSLAEVSHLMRVSRDLEYLTEREWEETSDLKQRTGYLLWQLYRSL